MVKENASKYFVINIIYAVFVKKINLKKKFKKLSN